MEDQLDVDMNNSDTRFDNLTILKELSNIANLVRNEDFLETVPKSKLRRVKWVPMFNCLKQSILDEMVQEISDMWAYEGMREKLQILDKQKEKFAELNVDKDLWRPQLADVKAQLRAHDIAILQKQKKLLETLAKEYETRVNKLKKTLSAKRGYIKALQFDIQDCQKKNEELISSMCEKIKNHHNLANSITPQIEGDMEEDDNIDNA